MKRLNILLVSLLLTVTSITTAQDSSSFFTDANSFFKTYVSNGLVDYQAVKDNPAALDALLSTASNITVSSSDASTYQAFWINAYNLAVIKGIVNNYPVKSPLDIGGFFDKTKYQLGGEKITLNDVENVKLRKVFPKEARVHFVLVCAGLGCPPIIAEAYIPGKLESQLQRQTELALNNPNFVRMKGKKVLISQIFEWYKKDFTQFGSEIEFINKFRKEPLPEKSKIGYYPYDWTLNGK